LAGLHLIGRSIPARHRGPTDVDGRTRIQAQPPIGATASLGEVARIDSEREELSRVSVPLLSRKMIGWRPAKRRVTPLVAQGMGQRADARRRRHRSRVSRSRSRRKVAVGLCGDQALADAVRLLLAGRVVRDGEPQGPGVRPGPPRSCSIMTEPIRRRICKSLRCESGVDLGSRRRVGARPRACDRGYQGRCIDDADERRLVDRRQGVAVRAAD
jgi:hypothetical protein